MATHPLDVIESIKGCQKMDEHLPKIDIGMENDG